MGLAPGLTLRRLLKALSPVIARLRFMCRPLAWC